MKRVSLSSVAIVALIVLASGPLAVGEPIDADITVSPNVINISSASTVVTIHTDLPYSLVVGATVTLNGVEIDWWKSDNQGNFVAKFAAGDIKDIVTAGQTATLTLAGETRDGQLFSGSDAVKVVDISGKK